MVAADGRIHPADGQDRLSETFAALANSTRRAILARLAHGEATGAAGWEMAFAKLAAHVTALSDR